METNKNEESGLVFNIQKFSVHDGPGIRTLVFFKGCPLRCAWCSNPESWLAHPQILHCNTKCIHCAYCLQACPHGAIADLHGQINIDRKICTNCGACAQACPAKALELNGQEMTVQQVLDVVEEDLAFYARSDGGLTLSGGEVLLQPKFARALLKEARQRGIDTAIETSGMSSWETIKCVFEYADTIHYDIKCFDGTKHKAHTKVHNDVILNNFEQACSEFHTKRIIARTPVVPGFNDTEKEISSIAAYLKKMPRKVEYELLGYHRFGEGKYHKLGMEYPLADVPSLDSKRLKELQLFTTP